VILDLKKVTKAEACKGDRKMLACDQANQSGKRKLGHSLKKVVNGHGRMQQN